MLVTVFMMFSLFAPADSIAPEVFLSYGSFYRPVDDGIRFDSPGIGGTVAIRVQGNWFAEVSYVHSSQTKNTSDPGYRDSVIEFDKAWRIHQVNAGAFRRWGRSKGFLTGFAGGGMTFVQRTETSSFRSYLRNPDGSLSLFEQENGEYHTGGPDLFGSGGIEIAIRQRILLRAEVEMVGVWHPMWSWTGVKVGIGYRF